MPVVVLCVAMALAAAVVVRRVAPPSAADAATLCAIWIALYPVARLRRSRPWWVHWANGIGILIGFLLARRFYTG